MHEIGMILSQAIQLRMIIIGDITPIEDLSERVIEIKLLRYLIDFIRI